ncbi:T9SS type A sorting domain-containing protein, partial [bacterium]|nr:T9SS type A sorting domain-containing protein [bacterium]
SVQQTTDGGYILAGYTESIVPGLPNAWLVRTNVNGDSLWSRNFGDPWIVICNSVQQVSDNGFILGGFVNKENYIAMWAARTDVNGDTLWCCEYCGRHIAICKLIQQNSVGDFFLAGSCHYNPCFVWADMNGDSIWGRSYNIGGGETCLSAKQTLDGGYIIAGFASDSGGWFKDVWLFKIDENGDSLWSRTFGGNSDEQCFSVQETSDGGYILAGFTSSFGAGSTDFWLVKVNANGDSLWSRTYGGSGYEECRSIQQTLDGGYILAGYTMSFGAGERDFWLVKTDSSGDSLWSRTFGGNRRDDCYSAQQTADGGYILAGYTGSYGAGNADFWLVKTGPDPIIPFPPGAFERVLPEDSTLFDVPDVEFVWTRSIDPNGDDVTYLFHIESPTFPFLDTTDYTTTDTSIVVDIPWPLEHLDEIHTFYWTVHAAAEGDTVEASNGEGLFYMDIIGIADEASVMPLKYSLSAYPNPFNPSTRITFDLKKAGHVSLKVFDLLGREVAILVDEVHPAGIHNATFDGSDLPSGIYFYRLQAGDFVQTKKMVLLK